MMCVGTQLARSKGAGVALLAAFVLSLLALPASAGATGILDQQQPDISDGGIFIDSFGGLAQTFTAGRTGVVDQVDLGVTPPGPGIPVPIAVEIRSVDPSGAPSLTVLGTATSVIPGNPFQPTFVSFVFNPPVPVTAGTQYAIAPYATDLPGFFWQISVGDAYAGGKPYARMFLPDETWVPDDSGTDFAFKTYIATAAPTAKSQCKKNGWKAFPQFKNQGRCVSFVQSHSQT